MKLVTVYYLLHNGKRIYKGDSYGDCREALELRNPNSWEYDLDYGHYEIKETSEQQGYGWINMND